MQSISSQKYIPATLIIGVSLLIELVIASVIPHPIIGIVLISIGIVAGIVGLILAFKMDETNINRKRIITANFGILISMISYIVGSLTLVIRTRITGLYVILISSFLLFIVGRMMIIFPIFGLNVSVSPSFGKVSKYLVIVPFTVIFCVAVLTRILILVGVAGSGKMFSAMVILSWVNLIVPLIGAIIMFAGLIVGIVKYVADKRKNESLKANFTSTVV
jgi:hypothetical protein